MRTKEKQNKQLCYFHVKVSLKFIKCLRLLYVMFEQIRVKTIPFPNLKLWFNEHSIIIVMKCAPSNHDFEIWLKKRDLQPSLKKIRIRIFGTNEELENLKVTINNRFYGLKHRQWWQQQTFWGSCDIQCIFSLKSQKNFYVTLVKDNSRYMNYEIGNKKI